MDGGQLVVGMYVRAWLEQDLLSIERALYFLPPLKVRYQPSRDLMARGAAGAAWDAVSTATPRTLPVLAGKAGIGQARSDFAADLKKRRTRRGARSGPATSTTTARGPACGKPWPGTTPRGTSRKPTCWTGSSG